MDPRAGLDERGKSRLHRDSIPGPPSMWQVATPTKLSRPTKATGNVTIFTASFYDIKSICLRSVLMSVAGHPQQTAIISPPSPKCYTIVFV